jgi:hypothetical protein
MPFCISRAAFLAHYIRWLAEDRAGQDQLCPREQGILLSAEVLRMGGVVLLVPRGIWPLALCFPPR